MMREGEGQSRFVRAFGGRGMWHMICCLLNRYERGNADEATSKGIIQLTMLTTLTSAMVAMQMLGEATVSFKAGSRSACEAGRWQKMLNRQSK